MNIEQLIQDLRHPDRIRRMEAAESLGKTNSDEAVEPLMTSLQDTNPEVRYVVVKALGHFNDKKINNFLINFLKDPAWYVRVKAGIILENKLNESGQSFLEFLFVNDPHKLAKLSSAFGLITLDKDPEKKYLKFILKLLNDDDINIRIQTVAILGDIGEIAVINYILDSFKGQNDIVKEAFIHALSRFQSEKVEQWLVSRLNEQNSNLRSTVVKALESFKTGNVVSHLIKVLNDNDSYVRCCAVIALGNIRQDIAIQPLLKKLKDEDKDVVYYTKKALAKIEL